MKALLLLVLATPLAGEPLTLTFAGDLMAHERNQSMPRYADIYAGLAPWLKSDDASFVNLETPADARRVPSGYPRFNTTRAYVEAAIEGGFDVFSLANNHANDYAESSVEGTLATMTALAEDHPIAWSGLKRAAGDAIVPTYLNIKGWRIAFVALTNLLNGPAGGARVNKINLWYPWDHRENPAGEADILDRVASWRKGADLLIVSLHDGVEYSSTPDPIQVAIYRRLVEAGVDVFWAHHPHVLQPWEWVDTPRGKRLLMFSMGNFISRQPGDLGPKDGKHSRARTGDSALMRVTFTKGASVRLQADPLMISHFPDPERGMVVIPTETLLQTAPERWLPYFRHRWEVQRAWLLGD